MRTASDSLYTDVEALSKQWDQDASAAKASGSGPTALLEYEKHQTAIQTSLEKLTSYIGTKIDNFQSP